MKEKVSEILVLILTLIFVFRPLFATLSVLLFFLGAYLSSAFFDFQFFVLMGLLFYFVNFIVYGLNDVYDGKSDKKNLRKLNIRLEVSNFTFNFQNLFNFLIKAFQGIYLEEKYHNLIKFLIIIYGVFLLIISWILFSLDVFLVLLIILIMSVLYSVPPFRFKTRPPLDLFINVFGYPLFLILGFSLGMSIIELPSYVYYIYFFMLGFTLYTQYVDYEVDKKSGDTTFCVMFGKKISLILAIISFMGAFVIITGFLILKLYIVLFCLVLLFLFFNPNFKNFKVINIIFLFISLGLFFHILLLI